MLTVVSWARWKGGGGRWEVPATVRFHRDLYIIQSTHERVKIIRHLCDICRKRMRCPVNIFGELHRFWTVVFQVVLRLARIINPLGHPRRKQDVGLKYLVGCVRAQPSVLLGAHISKRSICFFPLNLA